MMNFHLVEYLKCRILSMHDMFKEMVPKIVKHMLAMVLSDGNYCDKEIIPVKKHEGRCELTVLFGCNVYFVKSEPPLASRSG